MPEAQTLASGIQRLLCALVIFLLPPQMAAQTPQPPRDNSITVRVVSDAGTPLSYSAVAIIEAGVERFSNQRGEFFLAGMSPGTYRVRVKQLGYTARDTVAR